MSEAEVGGVVPRRQSLSALYTELNTKYFKGRLPKCRVVFSISIWPALGRCLDERRLIQLLPPSGSVIWGGKRLKIHTAVDIQDLRQTLLHEMCHIGVPSHGGRFQRRLLDLAAKGETWAAWEAEQYKSARSWNEEMGALRGRLDDWAAAGQRIGFRQLVRAVAGDFGMSRGEVLRRIPWLKAVWRRVFKKANRQSSRQ